MAVSRGYEADEEKDWVLDSLDRYERLHVFELQEPTLCIEWSHDDTALFLAGFSQEKHNELLQLILPEKLIAADKQTLLAGRDFKIGRGALAKGPIHHIRCVDQKRNVIITSGLGPELTVWGPDPGSPDLLVSTGNVTTPTPTSTDPDKTELLISRTSGHPQSLVSGSSLNTLQVTDLNTLQPLWSYSPEDMRGSSPTDDVAIHAMESLSGENHIFLTCSDRGELILWDSRVVAGTGSLKCSPSQTAGASSGGTEKQGGHAMAVCGNKCATLSDRGRLRIFDRRGAAWIPQASCASLSSTVHDSMSSWSQFKTIGTKPAITPCVQFSQSSNELSVSGPGRGVAIYDIVSWSNDITNPSPVFFHEGHEVDSPLCRVTVHSWHPSFHSMILSCDSDGVMHAWQWRKDRN